MGLSMKNVLLVEPNELVRAGIKQVLSSMIELKVIAETANAEGALQIARQQSLDLIIMEWNTPGITGLEATSRLLKLQPQLKVVILTNYIDMPIPSLLMTAGALGFISKASSISELTQGLRLILAGRPYISVDVAQQLAQNMARPAQSSPFDTLSIRELQVMLLVLEGVPVSEISRRLCLSPKTVSTYRYRLFGKLNIKSEVELTKLAMRYGMIEQALKEFEQNIVENAMPEVCEVANLKKAANF